MPRIHAVFKKGKEKDLTFMLNLRLQGFSTRYLAFLFGADRKAIKYQCQKHGVFPWEDGEINLIKEVQLLNKSFLKESLKDDNEWEYVEGEKVKKPKSYKEYLEESEKRTIPLLNRR